MLYMAVSHKSVNSQSWLSIRPTHPFWISYNPREMVHFIRDSQLGIGQLFIGTSSVSERFTNYFIVRYFRGEKFSRFRGFAGKTRK